MVSITVINSFEISAGHEDDFLGSWAGGQRLHAGKPGYLGHKGNRARGLDAPFRFINLARGALWERFQAVPAAGLRELVCQPEWSAFVTVRFFTRSCTKVKPIRARPSQVDGGQPASLQSSVAPPRLGTALRSCLQNTSATVTVSTCTQAMNATQAGQPPRFQKYAGIAAPAPPPM
jgi:hypothetical protein